MLILPAVAAMTRFVWVLVALMGLLEVSQAGFGRNHVLKKVSKEYNKQLQRACQNPAFMEGDDGDQRRFAEDKCDVVKCWISKLCNVLAVTYKTYANMPGGHTVRA